MSQTPCKRCGFPVPMRWLRAGGDLFRPDSTHQCPDRALMPSEHPPIGASYTLLTSRSCRHSANPVSVTSIIELGARIKSP